jgi:uncharacterized membrane protein (UPF0127 family)
VIDARLARGGALALAVFLLATPPARAVEPARLLQGFGRSHAMIETGRACLLLEIWLAITPDQRAQGLMYVRELDEFEGMLFPTREPVLAGMWMKNTYIPLDMLFIRENGRIARIAARTKPLSEETISAGEPVTGVLELAGGFSERHGVAVGDRFTLLPL